MRINSNSLVVPFAFLGSMGLIWIANEVSHNANKSTFNETIAVDFQTVWASQKFIDFARAHDPLPPSEELKTLMQREKFQGTWYGVTNRSYKENGDFEDLSRYIVEPNWFIEGSPTQPILRMLAGHAVVMPGGKKTLPKIVVLSDALFEQNPQDAFLVALEKANKRDME